MDNENMFWFDNVEFRTHPWPGLNWVTSLISVPDVKRARDIYQAAFGFVPIFDVCDDEGELVMTRMRYRGANFVLNKNGLDFEGVSPAESKAHPPFIFYVYVDNAEEAYVKALKKGFKTVFEPRNEYYGDRRSRVKCPFGYVWDLAQRVG